MITTTLRIGATDVILTDYEPNQGKIIISNSPNLNFSYYWGSMGGTLKEFLLDINESYFINKLHPASHGDIDINKTMSAVRKWWKEESGIAWYQEMDLQKQLRDEFNIIQNHCDSEQYFVELMYKIPKAFYFPKTMFKTDFEDALDALSYEPWNFIVHGEHREHKWLRDLFYAIRNEIAGQLVIDDIRKELTT